jgi:hypothetical protein
LVCTRCRGFEDVSLAAACSPLYGGHVGQISRNCQRRQLMHVLGEGQAVRHGQYGMGVVTESNSDRTTVDFDDFGTKKFITSIWMAETVGEAPAKPPRARRARKPRKPKVLAVAAVGK